MIWCISVYDKIICFNNEYLILITRYLLVDNINFWSGSYLSSFQYRVLFSPRFVSMGPILCVTITFTSVVIRKIIAHLRCFIIVIVAMPLPDGCLSSRQNVPIEKSYRYFIVKSFVFQ
uniref:Uncharacterized protein n=1 Tax=Cacopsylla melanoneura TaxID=428564 RepID=A0A8D8M1H4_9HEMI